MEKDQKKDSDIRNPNEKQDENVHKQPDHKNVNQNQQLKKEDLPDSTIESKGNMGSGQRHDSN